MNNLKSKTNIECTSCPTLTKCWVHQLPVSALTMISKNKTMSSFERGDLVFREGTPSRGFYFLQQGKLKLTINRNKVTGKTTLLRIVGAGALLGPNSLFTKSAHLNTAITLEPARVCFISEPFLQELLNQTPLWIFEIFRRQAMEMNLRDKSIADLTQKSALSRICSILTQYADEFGISGVDGLEIPIKLNREELASMAGVTTETLIRSITRLKNLKVIHRDGKLLNILDYDLLQKCANEEIS